MAVIPNDLINSLVVKVVALLAEGIQVDLPITIAKGAVITKAIEVILPQTVSIGLQNTSMGTSTIEVETL